MCKILGSIPTEVISSGAKAYTQRMAIQPYYYVQLSHPETAEMHPSRVVGSFQTSPRISDFVEI